MFQGLWLAMCSRSCAPCRVLLLCGQRLITFLWQSCPALTSVLGLLLPCTLTCYQCMGLGGSASGASELTLGRQASNIE